MGDRSRVLLAKNARVLMLIAPSSSPYVHHDESPGGGGLWPRGSRGPRGGARNVRGPNAFHLVVGRLGVLRTLPGPRCLRGCHLLLVVAVTTVGCVNERDVLMKAFDVSQPYAVVKPSDRDVTNLDDVLHAYQDQARGHETEALQDLSLAACLRLGVERNRRLRRATYATQRIGFGRDIARSKMDAAALTGSYAIDRGPDGGEGRIGATSRVGGFNVEPFVAFDYVDTDGASPTTSYGLAVSRNVFRIRYEILRQKLPLTRATRDYHIAINNRVVQLRELRLNVVSIFYDIQRLKKLIEVRRNRVADAKTFLERVREQVRNGFSAPVEETNAGIDLNQAASDLVREETNLRNRKEELLVLIGQDVASNVTIRSEQLDQDEVIGLDLESDMAQIRQQHERVINQLLVMEVQRQEYRVSGAELAPDLDARLTASQAVDDDGARGNIGVDLTLSVPLDGYRAEKAHATQQRLQLMEMAVDLAEIRSVLERDLRARYRNVHQLRTTVGLNAERLQQEQKKLGATLELWEKTKGNNLEVTRAKQAVDNAEVALLESRVRRIVEEARYRSLLPTASPRPIVDRMEALNQEALDLMEIPNHEGD